METFINDSYISDEECVLCHETEDYTLALEIVNKSDEEDFVSAGFIYVCPSCLDSLKEQYFEMLDGEAIEDIEPIDQSEL